MKRTGRYVIAATSMVLGLGLAAASTPELPVNLSGYEFLLGTSCTINGQPGKCGVEFLGWTGGGGQMANGWTPLPGTRLALWKATVDYIGQPEFGKQVALAGGTFDVLFTNGAVIAGHVTGGVVAWPTAGGSTVCGTDVAEVRVNVAFRGVAQPGVFHGCLHDLPAGTVIPPKIWGTLE